MTPDSPRVALLTANGLRHTYAAASLAQELDMACVVIEEKTSVAPSDTDLDEDAEVIRRHFAERDAVENEFLGAARLPDCEIRRFPYGGANSPEAFSYLRQLQPDVLMLYGSSIIQEHILTHFEDRTINLHLGLSPYYRGTGTNFWPLVNDEPECVGGTIHLAVAKVDAGPILAQVRPKVEASDRVHELGTKALMASLEAIPSVVRMHLQDRMDPQPQNLTKGKVFKMRDFTADAVRTVWRNLDAGMIARYLSDIEERQERFPIIELP